MADYERNILATEEVNYKSAGGIDIKIIVGLKEEMTRFCEGLEWSRKSLDIYYKLELNDEDQGLVYLQKHDGGEMVAKIGKVGMNSERYNQVTNALKIIESNEEWQKKQEAIKLGNKIEEEYYQHTARVYAAMNM